MIEIELPWPDKVLNPNARVGWRRLARARKDARRDGYWCARETEEWPIPIPDPGTKLLAQYMFYPPDRRKRDQDNHSAMMKSYQDGICDAFEIDDSQFQMAAPVWGEVVKGGKVVLRLEEME